LELLIADIRRLKGEISILSNEVGKTLETATSKVDKAVAGLNEACSNVPKDKVEVRHVYRLDPQTLRFFSALLFVGLLAFCFAWFLMGKARDKSFQELQGVVQTQKERITELEKKMIVPVKKKNK
jgi:hypothetical protein